MIRIAAFVLFSAFVLMAGGCALPPSHSSQSDLQTDLSRLKRQYTAITDELISLQNTVEDLDQQLQGYDARLEAVEQRQLTGQTQMGTSSGQITDKTPRIDPLERTASAGRAPSSATEIYLRAFSDYTSGRYDKAIAGFENFLEYYPDNEYAANAEFWIGECYYSQQKFTEAATRFVGLAQNYPQSARAPNALLKAAQAYHELGHTDQAREIVDFLREQYPDSAAAKTQLEF
ncbi:tol-pal system protein YbgF [Geoalkalibacter subterraneus]|uniref:tol-pal system protein YbgF n=1 Tax=Geoalkalibacter subterraneus TaxID=483547 RepID=UPI00069428A3|nr:tol-pal system protein YbgF [Geoalkalibacter subterraneus]